jgi:hypothetical protein
LTLSFTGTSLEIRYVEHPSFGVMAIEIDNTVVRTVNTASNTEAAVFGATQVINYLPEGEHTLRLYATEGVIAVDAIVANPSDDGLDIVISNAAERSTGVIVGFNMEFTPEGNLESAAAVQNQRAAIASNRAALLDSLSEYNVTTLREYQFIPFVGLMVDEDGLQALRNSPLVSSISENHLNRTYLGFANSIVGADTSHNWGYTGDGQVVAVLDTGVDTDHPFLTTGSPIVEEVCYSNGGDPADAPSAVGVCPGGTDFASGPGASDSDYCNSVANPGGGDCDHGTHVSGIAMGRDPGGADATGFNGVAPDADLFSAQVFTVFFGDDCGPDFDPPDACTGAWDTDVVAALDWVYGLTITGGGTYDNVASVNMSLGGGQYFDVASCDADRPTYKAAADQLVSANVAVVAASGNSQFKDSMGGPACISSIISVGATTTDWASSTLPADKVAFFSNSVSFLDLLAPGFFVQSSVPVGTGGCPICIGPDYNGFAGTSMASPMVAGSWALLREANAGGSTVAGELNLLKDTGKPVVDDGQVWAGTPFPGNGETYPRINVDAAVYSYYPSGSTPALAAYPADAGMAYEQAPRLEWTNLGASWYRISATSSAGPAYAYNQWVQVGDGITCTDYNTGSRGVCSLDEGFELTPVVLGSSATVDWEVQPYAGTTLLETSATTSFTINPVSNFNVVFPTGALATSEQAGMPELQWDTTGGQEEYYHMWIGDTSFNAVQDFWVERATNCVAGSCSAVVPESLSNGTYLVYIQPHGTLGAGPWSGGFNLDVNAVDLPAEIDNRTPADGSTVSSTVFGWDEDTDAAWYEIYVAGPNGFISYEEYSGADYCTGGSCSVEIELPENGDYDWWMRGGNAAGWGPWGPDDANGDYGGQAFTLDVALPAMVDNRLPADAAGLTSANATFEWDADAAATMYEIYVAGPNGYVAYPQLDVDEDLGGCAVTCTYTMLLPENGDYDWYMRAGNDYGYGPWGPDDAGGDYGLQEFTLTETAVASAPAKITPVTDQTNTQVTFEWDPVSNASYYWLYIAGPSGYVMSNDSVSAADCGATCTYDVVLPENGDYTWYLAAGSADGTIIWDAAQPADYGDVTFNLDAPAPTSPVNTLIAPADDEIIASNSEEVTFEWAGVDDASWYNLVVADDSGTTVVSEWYQAEVLDCYPYSSSDCEATVNIDPDNYTWTVLTWGPGSDVVPVYTPGVTPDWSFSKLGW